MSYARKGLNLRSKLVHNFITQSYRNSVHLQISRENERLKREVKELESKVSELQMMLKKSKSLELEKTSPVTGVYNTTFQKITTSVKGNTQNMEGLDTKLNRAQNKISTLEVELANDLRKFSLQRTSSDSPRRSFSPSDSRLSPGSYNMRRPRSYSNLSADDRENSMTIPRSGSSPSINGDLNAGLKSRSTPEISTRQTGINVSPRTSEVDLTHNLDDEKEFESGGQTLNVSAENQLSELDPFLPARTVASSTENLDNTEHVMGHFKNEIHQDFANEAMSFFVEEVSLEGSHVQEVVSVQEMVTTSSAVVTGEVTSPSPSMQLGLDGEEELIYF